MAVNDRLDPFRTFNFRLEIDNTNVAAFSDVSGLSSDGDVAEYRVGTEMANTVRKLVGLRKFTNITLKRGYTKDATLWEWYANITNGQADRRDGSVILMDEAHTDVLRWNFENAWINKIEGPTMNAKGNEVAIESIELVHEGLTMEIV